MFSEVFSIFLIFLSALIIGKLFEKMRLPSILGWLVTGVIMGPYSVGLVGFDTIESDWYVIFEKFFECFAGVMIGREIKFKKIMKSGKQILGITFIQSISTFIFVSSVFLMVFSLCGFPLYMSFLFGGIALATAPAPALSIINEYKTKGPVTETLIPLAAIDDVIGVIIFFSVISIIGAVYGASGLNPIVIILVVFIPFILGALFGVIAKSMINSSKNHFIKFNIFLAMLSVSVLAGIMLEKKLLMGFNINYLLVGMSFCIIIANYIDETSFEKILSSYDPILAVSLILVIVNLGMPLDYRKVGGAGVFTAVYILSRAIGKIGGAYIGGRVTNADSKVTKYLGFTLLPHSGVSLVFTGIATKVLLNINPPLADMLSGTIVAAAIINEIVAVILAKNGFKMAGEIKY